MKEALVALAGGGKRLSAREEEILALLAVFPDGGGGGGGSDRELSFSDLVEAGARPPSADADLGAPAAAPREDRATAGHEAAAAAASKQQRQQAARLKARRSGGSRGSYGGGGDGVLLNFYVPGLLTRSMTTPRHSRGPLSPGAVQGAPAKPAAGKASRTQRALGIGCFPALWGRGRGPAKVCS
ncbi:hypothetical protein BDA96_09G191800 [Sorghum bicolor]|uniref:Uncharacterized protein n=2 Tax=Sorghum bicolor TaxID=4558 RepID=A0A921U4M7_SORBI|nr:homeobox protein cut-like 1 [Sorghum bicolor]KAG0518622.1 hypothetical protein BDA96_09G191800 [Sorghum bicolor]KXG22252.1 hypothetical protein SORBI_3009G181400 [Sorghum bicolor]|eukprot:XP_002439998.2 homeobox protein cut-like 1 [Sorghum bicolor]